MGHQERVCSLPLDHVYTLRCRMNKVPISERALFERIKRKVAKEGLTLHRCRQNSRWFNELGPYYVVNNNHFVGLDANEFQELAKDLGCIAPHEYLEE